MTSQISSIYGTLLMMWSDDVWRSMAAVSMAAIFHSTFMPRQRSNRPSIISISSTAFFPSLFMPNTSLRLSFTKSFNFRIPTLSSGMAMRIGISISNIDADNSCFMCNLISSYLSNVVSVSGVAYIIVERYKKWRGEPPPLPKSNQ